MGEKIHNTHRANTIIMEKMRRKYYEEKDNSK